MTVETLVTKVQAAGNDVATVFSFSPVVIFETTDLEVTVTDVDGVDTVIAEGTDIDSYIVTVTEFPGTGSITYPATGTANILATGETITIRRVLPLTQTNDLENQGGYFPEVQEESFDRGTMIDQTMDEELSRVIQGPVSDPSGLTYTLPPVAARASQTLIFDSSGNATAGSVTTSVASAFGETLITAANATAARAVMEIPLAFLSSVAGTDTITALAETTITAYVDKMTYVMTVAVTNTGSVTINIDGVGATSVVKGPNSDDLAAGDFVADNLAFLTYNATNDEFLFTNASSSSVQPGYIQGGEITRNVTDSQNFDVASGTAADSTDSVNMTLQAFTKEADSSWVVGDGNGALLTGALAANTAYNIWAILTDDQTSADYGIDTVGNGITNIPAGYTLSRQIGRLFTDADINVLLEVSYEDEAAYPPEHLQGIQMSIGLETTAITSVTNNGGTAQFDFTPGPTLIVGQPVTLSGFSESTYNGLGVVTVTGAGAIEVNDIAFVSDLTGSMDSQDFNTVTTTEGTARDDANTTNFVAAPLTKLVDTTWAVGDNAGGAFTAIGNSTTCYYFAIKNDTDGNIDFGWDTSIVAANIPSGYTAFKLLSAMQTDSGGELIDSMQGQFVNDVSSIVTSSLVTLDHGLGFRPELQDVFITLVNVITEIAWVPGDMIAGQFRTDAGGAGSKFVNIYTDETSVFIRFSNAATVFTAANKTTGAIASITNANWRIRTRVKITT